MMSTRKTITIALMCALVLDSNADGLQRRCYTRYQAAAQRQMPPTEIMYVTAKTGDQMLETVLSGRTSAFYEAEVRPQVNGILQKKLFKDGTEVKAGDQLYQIDAAPYQAAIKSAEAAVAQAQVRAL